MGRKKSKPRGTCTYCGTVGIVTKDHIPPRCLFPPGFEPPHVPACLPCNNKASGDDEHFRAALALRGEVFENPVVGEIMPAILRGISRSGTRGNTGKIVRTVDERPHFTASGLYAGFVGSYVPDESAMARVVARTLRGLHFRLYGERLSDEMGIIVHFMKNVAPDVTALAWVQRLGAFAAEGTVGVAHPDVFMYGTNKLSDKPGAAVWAMVFYKMTSVLCLVVPRTDTAGLAHPVL